MNDISQILFHLSSNRIKLLGILQVRKKVIYGLDEIILPAIMQKTIHFAVRQIALELGCANACDKDIS